MLTVLLKFWVELTRILVLLQMITSWCSLALQFIKLYFKIFVCFSLVTVSVFVKELYVKQQFVVTDTCTLKAVFKEIPQSMKEIHLFMK